MLSIVAILEEFLSMLFVAILHTCAHWSPNFNLGWPQDQQVLHWHNKIEEFFHPCHIILRFPGKFWQRISIGSIDCQSHLR
jgi:hypothetical protein